MLKSEAVRYFGGKKRGTLVKIAKAAGVSRQSVQEWDRVVPPRSAIKLEIATKGELPVRPEVYK